MKLSILICSLESRRNELTRLLFSLVRQLPDIENSHSRPYEGCMIYTYSFPDVEIIVATDNKQHSTGAKRNLLLHLAKGQYISFIDDDDEVYKCYIEEILKGVERQCDCMAINGIMTTDGKDEIKWKLAKDYPNKTIYENGKRIYVRTTNHLSPVRRELALKAMFPNISNAEDKAYSEKLNQFLITEYIIEPPMYHYKYSSTNKSYK